MERFLWICFGGACGTAVRYLVGLWAAKALGPFPYGTLIVNVVGYWLIGLPLAAYLGLGTAAGPAGLWWGLVVGLAAVALILVVRVRMRLRGTLERLVVEGGAPAGV